MPIEQALIKFISESLLINKLMGVFLVSVGVFGLHGNFVHKDQNNMFKKVFSEKAGHDKTVGIFFSVFAIIAGVYVIIS